MSDLPTYIDKSDEEIRKEVIEAATKELGFRNLKSTGVLRRLFEVFARFLGQVYHKFISPIYHETNLDTADGLWLDQWGLLLGVARKAATKTKGEATLIAYGDGDIDAGAWITVSGTDLRFKVLEKTAFSEGETKISVEAEFEGSGYNVSGEDEGVLTKVVSGVDHIVFKEGWISAAGTDEEDDDSYRSRIKNLWISQGVGNPPPSFYYYAESVDGVKEVKLVRTPRGYGTVDVIVVAENGMPSEELLQDVYDALYDHALICNDLQVKAPRQKTAEISIEFSGNVSENEVEEAVMQYVYGLGIGGRLEIRGIYDTLEAFDLDTVEVIAPLRDVQAGEDAIIVASVEAEKI